MTACAGRPALRDIDARRELRKLAVPALVFTLLGIALCTIAFSIDGIAHARVSRFERHAHEEGASIAKGPRGTFASLAEPWRIVPVTINDPSSWSGSTYATVFTDDRNENDVRIPTETKAFLGGLYDVQRVTGWSGAFLLTIGLPFGFIWLRRRQLLVEHPWRPVVTATGPRPRECVVEPERFRYRSRRISLADCPDLEIAGPTEAKPGTHSVVRRASSNRMYVVRGPRPPVEWPLLRL